MAVGVLICQWSEQNIKQDYCKAVEKHRICVWAGSSILMFMGI